MTTVHASIRIALMLSMGAGAAAAQVAYTDGQGRQWRHVTGTTGRSWLEVAAVCGTDGQTLCSGTLGGVDLSGWVWATQEQVTQMLAEFVPEIVKDGAVSGPAYTLPGLGFFNTFQPTWEFYTVVGGFFSLSAWSATESDGLAFVPAVSASYNPHDASFSVIGQAATGSTSSTRGVWLFIPAADDCAADLNDDGALDFFDLSQFLDYFAALDPRADLAEPEGTFDFFDVSAYLAAFSAGCP